MEEKARIIGQVDLFQKFIAGDCRTKLVTIHFPQTLVNRFVLVGVGNTQANSDALVLLRNTSLFNIDWDVGEHESDLLLLRDDIVDWVSSIKFIHAPSMDGETKHVLSDESLAFGKLMLNHNYFLLGINKIVPLEYLDECASTTMDRFETERFRWLVNVEINTNNMEFSSKLTTVTFPLVNVQDHSYVYSTSIGIVILMTVVGFLGLMTVVGAINGIPDLDESQPAPVEKPCGGKCPRHLK